MEDNNLENIVVLTNEDGEEESLEFLDIVNYGEKEYIVLLPLEDNEGEVVILEIESYNEETGEESYISVEDDEILQSVFEIFREKFKDEIDFD